MFAPPVVKPRKSPAGSAAARPVGRSASLDQATLQRSFGNQAINRLFSHTPVPTTLKVGSVDDPVEQEADRVADRIISTPENTTNSARPSLMNGSQAPRVSSRDEVPSIAPPSVHEVLRSPGQPLEGEMRTFMESRLGHDLSDVRVHSDHKAGDSARAVRSLAYTVGNHLVFGANQYSPTALPSRRLIAHELAHFVQQRLAGGTAVLRRQPAPTLEATGTPVDTSTRAHYSAPEEQDLAVNLVEMADRGTRDFAPYTAAIRAASPPQKRYVYRNPYLLGRLAETLDLASFDKCVALLTPDARGRVLAGMARLQKKYGLGEVSEEGAQWSERELAIVDRAYSKMTKDEQEMLRGIQLIRKKEVGGDVRHGKKITFTALTTGGRKMEFTREALNDPISALHEAGHLIQQKQPRVRMDALRASKTFKSMESARQRFNAASEAAGRDRTANPAFADSVNKMLKAVHALVDCPADAVQDNIDRLNMAESQADLDRANEHSPPRLEAHDRLKEYAITVEQWATEKQAIDRLPADVEKSFLDIVKKEKLATRDFVPFTQYVADSWPEHPEEFLVQCYATWRSNPDYMRKRAPKLFQWFEAGGHRGMGNLTK